MKKYLVLIIALIASFELCSQSTIQVFDNILFYDGYAELVNEPCPEGVIRHKNYLYAVKLSEKQLSQIGDSITLKAVIKASCDNYDRLANVNLAFVTKGQDKYKPEDVEHIEIARFITPFMNKNKMPDTVHYDFNISYLKDVFRNKNILNEKDIWVEFEVFGVPYAAQKQVKGCEGRIDVFYGSLSLITSSKPADLVANKQLIPVIFQHQLKNYEENATDEIGKTVKTVKFKTTKTLKDVKMVLITSNHGANEGGEEYIRRMHYIYFDEKNVLTYMPGRKSCEPYRYRNTQGNGIYEREPKSDEEWQSFSNWCPGDLIDTRIVELGELKSGEHSFKIDVPDAEFKDKQGYFPLSVYIIGTE